MGRLPSFLWTRRMVKMYTYFKAVSLSFPWLKAAKPKPAAGWWALNQWQEGVLDNCYSYAGKKPKKVMDLIWKKYSCWLTLPQALRGGDHGRGNRHTHTQTHTHTHKYTHINTHSHTHTLTERLLKKTHTQTQTHPHTHIHEHTHRRTHTHIQMHTHTPTTTHTQEAVQLE